MTHFENAELARSDLLALPLVGPPLPAVNAGDGSGVFVGVGLSFPDWADLEDLAVAPLSISKSKGTEALDRERERMEVEGVTFETKDWREEARRGKMSNAMTFTEGAQATTMARWFSITDHIIALAKRPGRDQSRACRIERRSRSGKGVGLTREIRLDGELMDGLHPSRARC